MSDLKNHIDGIFKAFINIGNERHRLWEIDQLEKRIEHSKTRCGSCYKWMTSQCKFERPSNKVTMNDRKCDDFKITDWTLKHISELESKITKLKTLKV